MPPIIVRSGDFKPSDPFGLYRDRANPLDPSTPAPNAPPQLSAEELAREDDIRRAEAANAQVDAQHQQLEAQDPGKFEVIDAAAYDAWRTDWEARQPGWLEDTARILGGSIAKGSGAIVTGLGSAITGLTNATTTPVINQLFGTSYGKANPLSAPAEWLTNLGEKTQEGVSFATREAIENSTPGGDLLDPSSWTLGEAPSAPGYAALVLDVFGQMVPVIAAAVAAGPAGGAIIGGMQGGGAAAEQAGAVIDQMAAEPGLLERESAYYREQIAAGASHEDALYATKAAAGQAAFWLTAPISGLGGFATAKIIDPATAIMQGKSIIARISGRAALSGLEEGVQEAAETVATNAGINEGAGTDLALSEGTFGDFLLGALAGGGPGAIAGAFSGGAVAPEYPAVAPNAPNAANGAPTGAMAPAAPAATPAGPLTKAREYGMQQAPAGGAGAHLVVNDPALPGMGAGEAHGQTVSVSPNQSGIDPAMVRVVLDDGSERVMGKRLLVTPQGAPLAPEPQALGESIAVSPTEPGKPPAGSRAIIEAPDLPAFNGTIEQYVTGEDGSTEALVVDDDGEVFQVPVTAVKSLGLTAKDIARMDRAENPPLTNPVVAAGTQRQLRNADGEPSVLDFPDDIHAQLYDLGRERATIKGLERTTGGSGGMLTMADHAPDRVKALADALGVVPERINEIADDYRYRAERAARTGTEGVVSKMHGLNPERLKSWRAEAAKAPGLISSEADGVPEGPDMLAAEPSPSDPSEAWWERLTPGARKAALASAGVKRSEKSAWTQFSKPIKAKLAVVRTEFEAVDAARAGSRALDAKAAPDAPQEGQIDTAANAAATSPANDLAEPSQAQKEAGNYKLGHHKVGGLDLSIENPAGSERKGVDKGGKPWSVKMESHYGYIKGTVGKDKDHIDVFVKPGTDQIDDGAPVFVVDQVVDGKFDEHKVMLGFKDIEEAREAYMENYAKGWKGLGGIGSADLAEFKQWLKSGNTNKPFGTLARGPTAEEANPWMKPVVKTAPKSETVAKASPQPSAAKRPAVDGKEPEGNDTSAPGRAVVAAEPAHEPDRQAMKNFKKGQRVEWTNPGTYRQPDGTTREGLVQAGTIENIHSKELGTFTVASDKGGSSMVPARMLRPEAGAEPTKSDDAAPNRAKPRQTAPNDPFAANKLFTADKVAAAKARLKAKMGQLNSGIDPEVLVDGMTIAGAYIEAGVRDFSDYAKRMTEDFGGRITPYLLSFWEGARNYPGLNTEGMTPADQSAKAHAGLINPLPKEEAAALGQELAPPKKRKPKTGHASERSLIQDFGVEHIDGWTETADGEGVDTDFGMRGGVKDYFLKDAVGYFNAVAKMLQEEGYTPADDAKGRPMKPVSKNESGPATSGDVSLTMRHPETGVSVYAHIGGSSLRGTVPTTKSGVSVMFRVGSDSDRYATRGMNQWAPVDLSAAELAERIHTLAKVQADRPKGRAVANDKQSAISELKALIARPALEAQDDGPAVQPAVESPARAGVGAAGRQSDVRPQPASPRADNRDLEAGKPQDVASPADSGRRRVTRARPAAADVGGAGPVDLFGDAGNGRAGAGRKGTPDAGTRDGVGAGTRSDAGPVKAPESVSPANTGPGNFHIEDPLKIVGGGQVARFEKNRKAIELLNTLRDEGRQATREEQEVLAGYTGWGSFGQDLFQGTWAAGRPKQGWEARDKWLRDNLGQQEWESLQRSITNAHYTDPPTVTAMWDMVRRMGFTGGRVLEPSMGIGNFFGMMPLDLKTRSKLSGIELEQVTGDMAKLLYPDANVSIMGYQDSKTPDGFYDLAIGNWPFEDTVIADRRYNRFSPYLHDYFYLKALDQVRAGGLVVGITSKGTLDKKDSTIRAELAKKGELVAAFRLPSGAFEEYAGTKVVTDIIILRKREQALGNSAGAGWIKSVPFKTPSGDEVSINEYYVANPSHVIGTIDFGHGTTFNRPGMVVHRPADMLEQIKRVTALVPAGAYQTDSRAGKQISYITNHTDDREGALTKTKNGLFIVRGEHLAPAQEVAKYEVKDPKATADRVAQLEALIDMRKAYAELIAAERAPDGKPESARKTLKGLYDAFTKAHGTLSDSYGLNYLGKIDDPFYPALAALEQRTDKGIKPAGILSGSTIRAPRSIANPSVSDAFVLARNTAINPSLKQIAEIAKKPEAEVRAELLKKGAVFELPGGDVAPSDIYLSGNVREKMRQARAALDAGNTAMQANVAALEKVMPPDVPYYNIEVQMGASWVPTGTYADYVAHMLNVTGTEGIGVYYTAGRWRIALSDHLKSRPEASAGFGTAVYPFSKLLNAAISNQTVTIRKKDSDGNEHVDTESTAEANDKVANMRAAFGDWLWSDPERRVELEAEYNEVRNAFASPSFDGSFLSFEGMALSLGRGPFDLREHQANAIWRALVMRRSLNAHEVGTGKTFTMGGIAVESRRYGIAKKPLIFAHNANSKSVAAEIQQMYPAAKVLYIDNLAPAQIDIKMRQIANDDWDAVVVPHSLISRFALTEETLMALAAEEIAAIEAEAYEAAKDDGVELREAMLDDEEALKKLRSPTAKDLVKMRNRIIENIKKQGQRASKEGAVSFEDLGIDMVMVDEVHEFKKPPFSTRMRIKGLNTQSSDKSIALAFLTRYIRSTQNGGNVHLFTGTPVTNTLTEVFHMMRYMMAEEMADMSVDQWDGWFGSFAKEVQDVELNAAAEYEAVNRLAGFINVPELRRMIGQYMDVVFAEDMPEMKPRRTASGKVLSDASLTAKERAELLNGRTENAMDRPYKKVIVETADLTTAQQREFGKIQGYAKRWREMTGKQKKDAMLIGAPESPIIYENLAAKASFDVRLMRGQDLAGQEGKAADDPNSKPSRAIKNIVEIYRSHPKATQVVFTNAGLSTTGTRSVGAVGERSQERFKVFSTVGDIVERLVQQGIPRHQIAVVDGSTSKDKRKEVADAMNRADIRVVIGSTQSLGVGVNMQRNLRAMHHLDAPWMPGDLEQRNGRGMRQANQWNTVLEYRYITDRIDGRRWQVLAIKQRFINAFLKADDTTRIIEGDAASEEESDILTTFAEAAGDPRVLIREKLKKKIEQFKKRQRLHDNGVVDAARSAKRLETRKDDLAATIKRLTPIVDKVEALSKATAGDGFSIVIEGKTYDSRGDAREAIDAYVEASDMGVGSDARTIGKFGGYDLQLRWRRQSADWDIGVLVDGELIEGKTGSLNSLEISLRKYREGYNELDPEIADMERSISRLKAQSADKFHQGADLARAESDFDALEADLAANPVPPPAWLRSGAPVDTDVMWKGDKHMVSGHRWNAAGWFVLTSSETGPVEMPYLEVQDEQGMPLYEERPFVAPEVVDKKKSAAAPAGGAPAKSVFDRWFDGSKVVDAEGKPKVVYHGANVWTEPGSRTGKLLGDFNVFNRMAGVEIVGHPPSMDTVGSWFSSEPDNNGAGMYVGSKGAIYPVFLAIKNPWRPASFDAFLDKMHLTAGRDPAKQNPKGRGDTEALRAWLKKEGYDGILFPKGMQVDGDKQEVWVALEPTQIKSAIGNKGTFDPANPDIRYSRAPAVSQAGTPNAVRQQLRRGGLGSMVDALEQADRLRIISSKEADTGLTGVQGYTDPDGTITLISDQIVGDPVAVLLHEAFHSGAAELLGTPAWRKLMLNLAALFRQFEQSKGSARKFYDAARARVSAAEAEAGTLTEPLRVEEFAAYAIEEQASAPAALSKWVDEFIGTLKAWALKRFGRQLGAITPSQLKAIAKYALLEAVGTPGSPSPGMASRRRSIADVGARAKATITRERIGQEIGGRLTDLKPAALATVPLNYFSDLKRPGMVAVDQYLKVKRLMDAYRGNKHAKVDEVAQEWRKYARLGLGGADAQGRGRAAALAGLMHETTLAGIDPSSTSEEMESKAGYAELRARYLAMPRAGQDLYRKVRDTYREQADELDAILLDNVRKTQEIAFRRAEDKYREKLAEIEASKLDKLDKSKARKDAEETYRGEMGRATYNMKARMTKLRLVFEASRVPAPYFPLARFGKYFVTVRNLDGTVLSFSKKETDAERQRLERDMRQAYPNATVESGLLVENGSSRDMMDPRIVAEIETLLGDAGVDGKVMDMIWQRYLETMPDLSARKRFIHRKGVAGFDGDALRTFASNQFHAAHQMARLKFGLELTELTNQVVDQAKKADDQVRGMQLANELRKRHEWVMNPTGSRLAQGVTQMMFLWYLAATPAAAIINLTQTVMMGIPVLGARLGGLGKATAAIGKASADVVRGRGSVRNSNLSAEEQRAMDAFYESGMIERSQAHDLAGVGETGVAYSPWRHKMMSIVSWAYHNVEVWNREVTALAAYRMAREQGHHEGKAIDIAHDLTWAAHFDYSNSSRPRFMQGDVAKVALVFQSHQINMWYRLFRDIHQSVKGESAEARKEARYQLAGILGMMSLMGGMTGFFGYNVLVALAGLAFDDDDDPRSFKAEIEGNIVDLFGKDLGGMVLKGVPGHLLGIDLTSRLGMADFFIRAPDGGAEGRDWFQELIIGALGVAPSTFLNGIDGAGLIMQGDVARGVEVLAPKAIKDLLQAFRYANEGVLSRKGDVVLERDQLNALDVFVEAMGFTPAKVAETYERMGTLKDAEQHVLDERRALMNRFALAVMTGDGDAKRSAIEAIKQWNRKPYARAVPITSDGLTQSLKSRARNAAKRQDGVLIADPELGHLLRQLMPEHMN